MQSISKCTGAVQNIGVTVVEKALVISSDFVWCPMHYYSLSMTNRGGRREKLVLYRLSTLFGSNLLVCDR